MFMMFKKYIITLIIFICLSACKGTKQIDYTSTLTEQEMYSIAMENFNDRLYQTAAESFERIEEKFIFTPIATRSIIMSIYSYYKAKKYDDSLRLIEYYKKINFNNEYIDYIYYMEILNKYQKVIKSKKDLSLINELLVDINNFAMRPTKYQNDILTKRKNIIDLAAINELKIYDYYINQNNLIGAMNHLQTALGNYAESNYTPEILYKLLLIYQHINYKEGVEMCIHILEKNYKNTKWYKYAI